jgi:heptosyltransferase-3
VLSRFLICLLRRFAGRIRKRPLRADDVRSILIVELTRLGDVVSAIPAIHLLKSHFTNATVHLLVDRSFVTLLKGIDLDVQVHGVTDLHTKTGLWMGVNSARSIRPDLAISMSPPRRNAVVCLASGAPAKVGYLTHVNTLTPYLLTTPVESFGCALEAQVSYGSERIAERGLKICKAFGIQRSNVVSEFMLRGEEYHKTQMQLRSLGVIPDEPYIVIHPFAAWEYRMWGLDRYETLIGRLLSLHKYHIVIVCGENEVDKLDGLWKRFGGEPGVHFYTSGDLFEAAVAIKGAALFIGNDSGPIHIAVGLGVKVLGMYGPAAPELTAPLTRDGVFLYKRVECSPCTQLVCVRPENPCLGLISTEEAYMMAAGALSMTRVNSAVANA